MTSTTTPHTCTQGPVCEQMAAYLAECEVLADLASDPMNSYAGFCPELPEQVEQECEHLSCLAMIHEQCIACMGEAMDELSAPTE